MLDSLHSNSFHTRVIPSQRIPDAICEDAGKQEAIKNYKKGICVHWVITRILLRIFKPDVQYEPINIGEGNKKKVWVNSNSYKTWKAAYDTIFPAPPQLDTQSIVSNVKTSLNAKVPPAKETSDSSSLDSVPSGSAAVDPPEVYPQPVGPLPVDPLVVGPLVVDQQLPKPPIKAELDETQTQPTTPASIPQPPPTSIPQTSTNSSSLQVPIPVTSSRPKARRVDPFSPASLILLRDLLIAQDLPIAKKGSASKEFRIQQKSVGEWILKIKTPVMQKEASITTITIPSKENPSLSLIELSFDTEGKILSFNNHEDNEEISRLCSKHKDLLLRCLKILCFTDDKEVHYPNSDELRKGRLEINVLRDSVKINPELHLMSLDDCITALKKDVKFNVQLNTRIGERNASTATELFRTLLENLVLGEGFEEIGGSALYMPISSGEPHKGVDLEVYNRLGTLFMYCYKSKEKDRDKSEPNSDPVLDGNTVYYIGEHFHPALFYALKAIPIAEIGKEKLQETTEIAIFAALDEAYGDTFKPMIDLLKTPFPWNAEDKRKIVKFLTDADDDVNDYLTTLKKNPNSQAEKWDLETDIASEGSDIIVKKLFLKLLREDYSRYGKVLKPLQLIAKGMLKQDVHTDNSLSDSPEYVLKTCSAEDMNAKIQGISNRAKTLNALKLDIDLLSANKTIPGEQGQLMSEQDLWLKNLDDKGKIQWSRLPPDQQQKYLESLTREQLNKFINAPIEGVEDLKVIMDGQCQKFRVIERKFGYLVKLIEDPNTPDEFIRRLNRFITGNPGIMEKSSIKIKMSEKSHPLPTVQTCYTTLLLSSNPDAQIFLLVDDKAVCFKDDTYEGFVECLKLSISKAGIE